MSAGFNINKVLNSHTAHSSLSQSLHQPNYSTLSIATPLSPCLPAYPSRTPLYTPSLILCRSISLSVSLSSSLSLSLIILSPPLSLSLSGYSRAFYELFEGAIYMHRATQFLVHKLDLACKRALSKPVRVGYYTQCRSVRTYVCIHLQRTYVRSRHILLNSQYGFYCPTPCFFISAPYTTIVPDLGS
jgi:hypothetical protein